MKTIFLPVLTVLLLGACDQNSFGREAGAEVIGNFGNATMQNSLVATGQVLPPMGQDKYDAPAPGMQLSGQYAAVVMGSYQSSAERPHPANTVIETQTDPSSD